MIALDALEQMHAQPFELIGADAGRDGVARRIQIGSDLLAAQLTHGHAGNRNLGKQYLAVARHRNGGMQFVRLAGKQPQLICRLRAAGRLAEQSASERQRLVGADDITAGIF